MVIILTLHFLFIKNLSVFRKAEFLLHQILAQLSAGKVVKMPLKILSWGFFFYFLPPFLRTHHGEVQHIIRDSYCVICLPDNPFKLVLLIRCQLFFFSI